jgi:hypothetical protein
MNMGEKIKKNLPESKLASPIKIAPNNPKVKMATLTAVIVTSL